MAKTFKTAALALMAPGVLAAAGRWLEPLRSLP